MSGAGLVRMGLVAAAFVAAAAALSLGARSLTPTPEPRAEQAPAEEDSGEVIDFAHLRDKDIDFLEGVLREGSPEGRRSAIRALVVAEDLRGARALLDVAISEPDEDEALLLCLAALDVLRLQRQEDVQRVILETLDAQERLPQGCVLELRDRFALLNRGDADLTPLATAPEPAARRHAARALSERPGEEASALLLQLAQDPDAGVRRVAWLAWSGRALDAHREALVSLAAAEADPEIAALAAAALEE
ncbi:MAG: hypothetical protein H6740_23960 [Alphaproteobacteria bacterium]|nr:hypothetical protein [Alphaproteobacteria bacterium]